MSVEELSRSFQYIIDNTQNIKLSNAAGEPEPPHTPPAAKDPLYFLRK